MSSSSGQAACASLLLSFPPSHLPQVRTEFAGCTVVAIAHRLHTIIDADNVLVMDAGRAAEFGPPAQLLSRPDGIFSGVCLWALLSASNKRLLGGRTPSGINP